MAVGAEPIRKVADVRALKPEDAARSLPVEIEGVVTYYNPLHSELLFHDGHDGIYVKIGKVERPLPEFGVGSQVRIVGVTQPGDFIPLIVPAQITVLGKGRLPEPHRIVEGELFAPAIGCQWVEVPAVVVGAENRHNLFMLSVEVSGHAVPVKIPWTADAPARVAQLMQRPVTIRGSAGTIFNAQRQLTGRFLFVQSFDDIVPSDTGTPAAAPLRAVNELLRYKETSQSRVRVQGAVTETTNGKIYLRGEGGSLLVQWSGAGEFAPGTVVEAEGFAAVAPFRPVLRATRVKELRRGEVPKPVPLDLTAESMGRLQAELVTVDAQYLGRREAASGQHVLQCRSHNWIFEATLPDGAKSPSHLVANSILRLTGICELTTNRSVPPEAADAVRLTLRDRDGIVLLRSSPWWTIERVLWALGSLGAVALAFLTWIAFLRRRLARQTKIIAAQIERSVITDERQRIARELHDTLEQDLAGTAAQLRNARRRLAAAPAEAGDAINLAERMLDHCREEARTSIRDLRSITLERRGLHGALDDFLTPVAIESGARFRLEVQGEPRNLPGPMAIHLLRIAHQAVANAAQHGSPREISVRLVYDAAAVQLEVCDDGAGFDPSKPSRRGHFGILGMRESVPTKMRAQIEIASGQGAGTCIRVIVPLNETPPVNAAGS